MATIEIDRSLIGQSSEPFWVEVEKGAIRKFAEAIGDPDERYRSERHAQEAGFVTIIAPPTFPVTFRPPIEPVWTRDLDRRRILAGSQSFDYERPIYAGDRLQCQVYFVGVDEKTGRSGRMELIRQEIRGYDGAGSLIFINHRTTVYRAPPNARAR